MTAFDRYRALLRKFESVRARNPQGGSPEEDALLDDLDDVWSEMSEGERAAASPERDRALGLSDSQDSASPPPG
ncbi:hypothetical protein HUA74_35860 [Myxococcus sp. CA051A]|uniref:Uncharacterized protein n=1 Tax=Myxococcus llanfairpwllgwyngyllgogerychwyrndrobwllllantysiliogogogochensis TaxID=2590453 RepID=A0A540X4C1_9BACT|nr:MULTISPECIES: hypothetical protein [Myxococcus]NTX07619.1 hypothetical protein [Myxococcus sp. CA040A]NTX10712.1 hypothetical protein [Myxococcus sp. CA056]NTX41342.1 hypothetical protein [Myxococcus sp. CA033]NTX50666.1 hypothetical protein [Myxococcus sp. CA039A]NTX66047.1 hypothetical protein [Myxococcus sp. CA051A]